MFVAPLADRLGGSEKMLWDILSRGASKGVDQHVVCLQDGPLLRELEDIGIPATIVPAGRLRDPRATGRALLSLTRVLRRTRPDLVVGWTAKAHLYAHPSAVAAGVGRRTVWWQHSVPQGHWVDRLATMLPAAAVGCSSHASAAAQQRLRPRRSTFVVHPGVEPPGDDTGCALSRSDLGIPDGRPVVTIVGRLQPWKGQDRVVEAMAALRERNLEAHLLVVGGDAYGLSPRYAEDLRQLVSDRGLSDHTTFTGHVASAAAYVALSDVAVNASEVEPFGLVIIEAMMLGVAVVAVNAGGPSEIIEHGRSGWLISDGRPATIASALERLLSDSALRGRVAAEGRAHALERFTASMMTRRLSDTLATIAKRAGNP